MIIAKETKERFVKMLNNREIIVIECDRNSNRRSYDYKFIGANSNGKWDFTPLVAECSGFPYSKKPIQWLSVRGHDAASMISAVINELRNEKIDGIPAAGDSYSQYERIRTLLTTFCL